MNRFFHLTLGLFTLITISRGAEVPTYVQGANTVEIVWDVPSNRWPDKVWSYRIAPHHFAGPVISNLMTLGAFSQADATRLPGHSHLKGERIQYYADKERTRELGIFPSLGWVSFKDGKAKAAAKGRALGVPTDEDAFQLAQDWLKKLGIDRSQLATKSGSSDLRIYREKRTHGWMDKPTGTNVSEVILRGVFFVRRVDGIDFNGIGPLGGVCFNFGNHGKVAELEIVWKGLEPFELHNTLTADQLMETVRSGRVKWIPSHPQKTEIKKITITDVTLLYRGVGGEDEEKYITPYARLAASVDCGSTNVLANIECAIIATLEPMANRKE